MRRIVILGGAGSGKSTLARLLGQRLCMPVCHLDQLFWQPGWTKPSDELFDSRVQGAVAGESWVIEGNYDRRTFKWRLPRADTLVWMDTPRITCLRRVLLRTWRGVRGEQRSDMAPGCFERFDVAYIEFLRYVWTYRREHLPRIEAGVAEFGAHLRVHRLASDADVSAFVAALPAPTAAGQA